MTWKPDQDRAPGKVLLIQFRRIGDAILVTPVLDALRAAWPETRLHLLTSGPIPDLFAGDPRVDVVWVRPKRSRLASLARSLRSETYDVVFDFQSLPLSAALARAAGGYRVGFHKRGRQLFYNRRVDLKDHRGSDYAADHKLDLLRAVGMSPDLVPPRLTTPPVDHAPWVDLPEGPRVAVVPVSLRAHKRWTPRAFGETIRALHEQTNAVFVLAAGPGEDEPLSAVSQHLANVPHRIRVFSRLGPFAAFLAGADLFVGNDNGPRHLALALGIPTLAYFGTQNPSHWTPPGSGPNRVLWDRARARGRPVREDLVLIPDRPDAAAAAAADLLRHRGDKASP